MTLEELKEILESTGLPVTYRAWPENSAPDLPYICYIVTGSDNFSADGVAFHKAKQVNVELYTETIDESIEKLIEDALDAAGIYWDFTQIYVESEEFYETIYDLEV